GARPGRAHRVLPAGGVPGGEGGPAMTAVLDAPAEQRGPARRRRRARSTDEKVWATVRVLTIAFLLLITVVPFWYMIVLSVKPIQDVLLDPGRIWVTAGELSAGAYRAVFRSTDDGGQGFLVFLRNSAIVSVITTGATLLAAVPGAYAVSRLRFGGRRLVSGLFLVVYLFPPMILAIPLFVLFARLFLLERPDRWTVSLGLSRLSGSIEVPSTVLMAGSVVLTVPIVVLFFVAERRLVEGLTAGGKKG